MQYFLSICIYQLWIRIYIFAKSKKYVYETDEIFIGSFDGCGDECVGDFLYEWRK